MELTKKDLDVIIDMLIDIDATWGLEPRELKLKEKIEKWMEEND